MPEKISLSVENNNEKKKTVSKSLVTVEKKVVTMKILEFRHQKVLNHGSTVFPIDCSTMAGFTSEDMDQ